MQNVILKGIKNMEGKLGRDAMYMRVKPTIWRFSILTRIKKDAHGTGDCYAAAFTGSL